MSIWFGMKNEFIHKMILVLVENILYSNITSNLWDIENILVLKTHCIQAYTQLSQ